MTWIQSVIHAPNFDLTGNTKCSSSFLHQEQPLSMSISRKVVTVQLNACCCSWCHCSTKTHNARNRSCLVAEHV